MRPTNLADELGQKLQPVSSIDSAWWFEKNRPAHRFRTVIATIDGTDAFVFTVTRDFFDERLAEALVTFVRNIETSETLPQVSRVVSGFRHPGYAFDELLLLGAEAHGYFENSRDLAARCLQAIPVFHGEFSGAETPEVIDLLRRHNVSSLDWQRSPSPQVWLYVPDARLGRKRDLTDEQHTLVQLQKIEPGTDKYLEIENYRGDVCRVDRPAGSFVVAGPEPAKRLTVAAADIGEWLHTFLIAGSPHPDRPSPLPPPEGEPTLRVFLSDRQRGREIRSDEAIAMSLPRALEEFDRLPNIEGCFVGFRRADGEVLQFIWNADGTLDADVPLPARKGSLQRVDSWQELRPLVEIFAAGKAVERLPGLSFRNW